jgi:hypothetical protein
MYFKHCSNTPRLNLLQLSSSKENIFL